MNNVNTPYDDVFHTLLNDCKQLTIPLINEMFHENHPWEDNILLLQNEHFMKMPEGTNEERITDSCILLGGKRYHIECQSTPDGSMTVRMYEYDSQIAAENGTLNGHVLEITFPESAVLYLRSTPNTPDRLKVILNTPGGSVTYYMPVMKMKNFSLHDIFAKKLYFLIPFYLFTFEQNFAKMESDKTQLDILKQEYTVIAERLEALADMGEITELTKTSIAELTGMVAEHLAAKYAAIRKEVKDIMGGKILEYKAKTIFNEGVQTGFQQGAQTGFQQGAQTGFQNASMHCYLNALDRGMSHEDAIAIADISEETAAKALSLRKEGKL